MLKKSVRVLSAIVFCFALSRCNEPGSSVEQLPTNLPVHDRMAVDLARSVSQSMNAVQVRDFLKSEAAARFDGDYDILLQEVRHKSVAGVKAEGRSSSPTFGEMLFGAAARQNGRSTRANGQALLDSLGALFPLMQIAVPALENASAEMWDTQTHEPLVAVMPQDYQEGVTKTIPAFDGEGRL